MAPFRNLASVAGLVARGIMGLGFGAVFGLLGPPEEWTGPVLRPLGRKVSEVLSQGPHVLDELSTNDLIDRESMPPS